MMLTSSQTKTYIYQDVFTTYAQNRLLTWESSDDFVRFASPDTQNRAGTLFKCKRKDDAQHLLAFFLYFTLFMR
jgi:hypothetical protein